MSKGFADGLAYRHDFSGAITNYQREDALNRARKADEMAQMKMLYEGVENIPDVVGKYDREHLAKKWEDKITEMGEYAKEHENWATDPEHYGHIKKMSKALQNDPETLRALSSTQSYKAMMAAIQGNPLLAHHPQMIENRKRWDIYNENGTVDPTTGAGFDFIHPGKIADPSFYLDDVLKSIPNDTFGTDQFGAFETISETARWKKAHEVARDSGDMGLTLQTAFEEALQSGKVPEKTKYVDWIYNYLSPPKQRSAAAKSVMESIGTPKTIYSQYDELFKTPVGRANADYLKQIIGYDDKGQTIPLNDGFVMMADGRMKDFIAEGGYIDPSKQIFLESLKGTQYKTTVTGNTVRLGREQTWQGDQESSPIDLLGIEVAIEIPLTGNSARSRAILEELEEKGYIENSDWVNWFGLSGNKDVDSPSEIATKSSRINHGSRKNADGTEEDFLVIRGMVKHKYSETDQMTYNSNYLNSDSKQRPIDSPSNANGYEIGGQFSVEGQSYRILSLDDKGNISKYVKI